MDWIFSAFLVVSLAHMGEEFIYPGGFIDFVKRLYPRFAPLITVRRVVTVTGLQLLLCVGALTVGKNNLAFSLSVAGLLFINCLFHVLGSISIKGYAPGVITGVVLYLPLSIYAYYSFWVTGQLTFLEGITSGLLGMLYQAMPVIHLALSSVVRRA